MLKTCGKFRKYYTLCMEGRRDDEMRLGTDIGVITVSSSWTTLKIAFPVHLTGSPFFSALFLPA
jgi:hypothetical protein